MPRSVAHFFKLSVAAALRSSPMETSVFDSFVRVIFDFPNWHLAMPWVVSFPKTTTSLS